MEYKFGVQPNLIYFQYKTHRSMNRRLITDAPTYVSNTCLYRDLNIVAVQELVSLSYFTIILTLNMNVLL